MPQDKSQKYLLGTQQILMIDQKNNISSSNDSININTVVQKGDRT